MSSVGRPFSAAPAWQVIKLAFHPPGPDASPEDKLAYEVRNVAVINGPNFLPSDADLRKRVQELAARSEYTPGMLRQFDAVLGTGSLVRYAREVTAPTVVLHGSKDPLLRLRNGRAVASSIPHAQFVVIDGMGHDLPRQVWRPVAETLIENFSRAPLPVQR
jgi:pimeloyl-ACP methyl ester carboxylesterase